MYGTEISTAVNAGAPVIYIVLNNGRLDMVEKGMKAHTGKTDGTVYEVPLDVRGFGQAMGAQSYRCRTGDEFRNAFRQALQEEATVVIEVMVDPGELPPTMARG
jgi:acetolactate synthase-1/2/3 large subunit